MAKKIKIIMNHAKAAPEPEPTEKGEAFPEADLTGIDYLKRIIAVLQQIKHMPINVLDEFRDDLSRAYDEIAYIPDEIAGMVDRGELKGDK